MRDTGNQSSKPIKPSPNPATLTSEPIHSAPDGEHGEGSYSGTRDYQAGLKTYLETADIEKDARSVKPSTLRQLPPQGRHPQAGSRRACTLATHYPRTAG